MIPKFRYFNKITKEMCPADVFNFDSTGTLESVGDYTTETLEIDQVVVMWSTGLFDKNGVEVFEGDVLQRILPSGAIIFGTVEFAKGMFLVDGIEAISDDYIVIGNIYENPELMEEVNDK